MLFWLVLIGNESFEKVVGIEVGSLVIGGDLKYLDYLIELYVGWFMQVNDIVGILVGGCYWNNDVMVVVILGIGINVCYVE